MTDKAEIERLKADKYIIKENGELVPLPRSDVKQIKAEAIKEFAERLKERTATFYSAVGIREEADNLVKEMTEGGVDNA